MKEIIVTCFVLAYSTFSMMADSAATVVKTTNIAEEVTKVHCYEIATLVGYMKENEGDDNWIYMIYIDTEYEYVVYEGMPVTCEVLE